MDWFHRLYEGRETFQDGEEELFFRESQRTITRQEVRDLAGILDLPHGAMIIDVCCGNGRHSIEFAEMGYRVIGFDISRSRTRFAFRWAKDERTTAYFFVGDVRSIGLRGEFESVVVLGGSFSHLLEERQNIALLGEFRRLLRKEGRLLIDNPNPLRFLKVREGGKLPKDAERLRHFDLPLGTGKNKGCVRYYGSREMARLLGHAGFKSISLFGDRQGNPYSLHSPRLIALASPC